MQIGYFDHTINLSDARPLRRMTVGDLKAEAAMSLNKYPKVKDIHLASSIEDLQNMAKKKQSDRTNGQQISTKNLKRIIETVYSTAQSSEKQGDQEEAYLFYFMASDLILNSHFKDVDGDYIKKLFHSEAIKSIRELETLTNQLNLRYARHLRTDESSPITNGVDVAKTINTPQIIEDSGPIKGITCKEMYDRLFSPNGERIFILQARSKSEYNKTRFHRLNSNVIVIQIDTELLEKFPFKKSLLPQLDVCTQKLIATMVTANLVILVDESSEKMDDNSTLTALYNAFFKFVDDKDKISAEKVFCVGGFREWQFVYPYSKLTVPATNGSTNSTNSADSTVIIAPSPHEPELFIDSEKSMLHEKPAQQVASGIVNPSVPSNIVSPSIPISTRPASTVPSRPVAPKPVLDVTSRPETAPVKPAYEIPSRPDAPKPVFDEANRPDTVQPALDIPSRGSSIHSAVDFPSRPLQIRPGGHISSWSEGERCIPHGVSLPETSMITQPIVNGSSESTHDSSQNSLRSQIKSSGVSSGGLSRSYSSPNINDLLDKESLKRPSYPAINRAIKPEILTGIRRSSYGGRDVDLICGLKNLGNTCYMNAIVQCLATCATITRYFMSGEFNDHIVTESKFGSTGGELARQLSHVFLNMRSNNTFAPSDFRKTVSNYLDTFTLGDQHDAHEFFTMLVDKLHLDLNQAARDSVKIIKKLNDNNLNGPVPTGIAYKNFYEQHTAQNRSIFTEWFEGILLSNLKCTSCSTESDTFEPFYCLSLPIVTNGSSRSTLADCWSAFAADESLTGDAAWDCTLCKRKRNAIKKIRICRLPKILVIHLKRLVFCHQFASTFLY